MNADMVNEFFRNYGVIAVFVIVFLEYMNLPGFPAGIIMPMAGIWAAKGDLGLVPTLILSVAAGLLGSWVLYGLGRFGGEIFLNKFYKRFPKQKATIEKNFEYLRNKGYAGIFVSKLIPMIRTIISIPAGVLKMNFMGYTVSSAAGIAVWNTVFVGAGYLLGEQALTFFTKL